jgi:hypothetical protein
MSHVERPSTQEEVRALPPPQRCTRESLQRATSLDTFEPVQLAVPHACVPSYKPQRRVL